MAAQFNPGKPIGRRLRDRLLDPIYSVYAGRLQRRLAGQPIPRHVGVLMDGNRRWAKEVGLEDVADGHRRGAQKLLELLAWCDEVGVELATVWLLSTDNLVNRPQAELGPLLDIIVDVVGELASNGGREIRVVGVLDVLPADTAAALKAAAESTVGRPGPSVNVAIGYGGRQEIADAVRSLLADGARRGATLEELAETLDPEHIAEHLYTRGQPDPDLLIRTSGEQRLSGFLLWQSAHSEFYFHDAYWPAFRKIDFLRALRVYANRHRRYGA